MTDPGNEHIQVTRRRLFQLGSAALVARDLSALDAEAISVRLKAAVEWLKIENRDAVLQQRDERFDDMTDTELVGILATKIGKKIIPVVEKFSEPKLIVQYARQHQV
mgnify:CR=1 FL=1